MHFSTYAVLSAQFSIVLREISKKQDHATGRSDSTEHIHISIIDN